MVYECPQCKTSLPPGVMACAKCGLQFATPIPADATVPPPGSLPLRTPESAGFASLSGDSAPPRRVVAVVAALGVVLVLAALYAIYTFSHTSAPNDSAPVTPVTSARPSPPSPGLPPGMPSRGAAESAPPASTGSIAPVQLSGGTGSSSGTTASSGTGDTALQGRWQAKNLDFYEFNADGTGSRGNVTSPAKSDNFTWVVTDNQLVLNGKKEERLTFSTGPDAGILYLRLPDGRNVKFARVGTS